MFGEHYDKKIKNNTTKFLIIYLIIAFLTCTVILLISLTGFRLTGRKSPLNWFTIITSYFWFIALIIALPYIRKRLIDDYIYSLLRGKELKIEELFSNGVLAREDFKMVKNEYRAKFFSQKKIVKILEEV